MLYDKLYRPSCLMGVSHISREKSQTNKITREWGYFILHENIVLIVVIASVIFACHFLFLETRVPLGMERANSLI